MRFLHTGDWHLGRTIRGRSRMDECARVLDEVCGIAHDEAVDVVLIAGDTFDNFSPPADAQKLLYETLRRLVSDGARVVMIAGNHDSAPRMDALAGILELAGVHAIGAPPGDRDYRALRIASRDGSEGATIVAVPWIPEHLAVQYEALFGPRDEAQTQYAGNMERALRFYCASFDATTVNVLLAHMMVSGTIVGEAGGERTLHLGDTFAVLPSMLPSTANYVALGHVHRPQPVANAPVAGGSFYAGSLLQLDFGEAEQKKSVRLVEVHHGTPAESRAVPITGGKTLRNVRFVLEDLEQHAGEYPDDYLRVIVDVPGVVPKLTERVLEVLPNAIAVEPAHHDAPATAANAAARQGLEAHELLSRYYASTRGGEIPADLLSLFNRMYEEAQSATA
jgi:exonuclease SbcD